MFRNSALGASFLKQLPCLMGGAPAPVCPSAMIPGPNLVAMKSSTCNDGGMPGQSPSGCASPCSSTLSADAPQKAQHGAAGAAPWLHIKPASLARLCWSKRAEQAGSSAVRHTCCHVPCAAVHGLHAADHRTQPGDCSLGWAVSGCSAGIVSHLPRQGTAQPDLNPAMPRWDRQRCAQAAELPWHRTAKRSLHVTCGQVGKPGSGPR